MVELVQVTSDERNNDIPSIILSVRELVTRKHPA